MFYVELSYTKDGGRTWSDWRRLEYGEVGDFVKRVCSWRFGIAQQIVFRERVSGDFRGDLISAGVLMSEAGR